jgi:hypothetical protein
MESCRELFGKLKILTFYSQYIYSLLCFVCSNKVQYIRNSDIRGRNTRYGSDFHYPVSNLALYQKTTSFMVLKVFNSLPSDIKDKVHDIKEFKQLIKNFLCHNTFYTLEEYFNHNKCKTLLIIYYMLFMPVRKLFCLNCFIISVLISVFIMYFDIAYEIASMYMYCDKFHIPWCA